MIKEKSSRSLKRDLRIGLTISVVLCFLISTVTSVVTFTFLFSLEIFENELWLFVISLIASCIVVGMTTAAFFLTAIVSPVLKLCQATQKIACGDFGFTLKLPNSYWSRQSGIQELTSDFNRMAEELRGIDTFRNDFMSYVSHELKTPLVSILGFARQLNAGCTPEEIKEYSQIIVEEAQHISDMSSRILLMMKFENQGIVSDKKLFRLDNQLRRIMLFLEDHWSKKNISITMDLQEVIYEQNEDIIAHLWCNLLCNAVKFTQDNGDITVTCKENNGVIKISIKDNGIGMDEETKSHLFEKFYQGDKAHFRSGHGIGLPIVKRIIEMVGGEISVNSELGKGSEFIVTLYNRQTKKYM